MSGDTFAPTVEQRDIIAHEGPAFVSACPGAGKTRVMVERARRLLADRVTPKAIAFLSFTQAAVAELETRLRQQGLLPAPAFPHFIGTFDSFVWQTLIAPFGACEGKVPARLVPDKEERLLVPFPNAQPLPLYCFDRETGAGRSDELLRLRFKGKIAPYEGAARKLRQRFYEQGALDFDDARRDALKRLRDPASGQVLSQAMSARFQEVIVDEAQDCNPLDLEIIAWLRGANVPVKVICDPDQAIYGFRGGVTTELLTFRDTFIKEQQLGMSGNFRSSQIIATGLSALRAPARRHIREEALGKHRNDPTPIQVLSYAGKSVPASVGQKFNELTRGLELAAADCPVVAATRKACASALGYPSDDAVMDLTYRLAMAVSQYHLSFELGDRKQALEAVHKVVLKFGGRDLGGTYHQYLKEQKLEPAQWRPQILSIVEALRYDGMRISNTDAWLIEARRVCAPLIPDGGPTINQRLRNNADLANALIAVPPTGHSARTIHSVKGLEFPGICVVLSPQKATGILDYLTSDDSTQDNEDARKLYVGASRAQRLLAIATPKSQASRLVTLLQGVGATVTLIAL